MSIAQLPPDLGLTNPLDEVRNISARSLGFELEEGSSLYLQTPGQVVIPYPFSDNEDSADDIRSSQNDHSNSDVREASPDTATSQDFNESDDDMDIAHPAEGLNTLKVEKVLLSAFLMKKGEKRKTWKKRWFVLRATILAYYKNEKEYELLKIIPLADVHAVAEVRDLKRRKNVLGVVTRQRTYYIMCDTKEQLEEWLNTIKDAHREVQRLMKKDSLASSQRSSHSLNVALGSSPARSGPLSAPLPSTTTSGNNIVQWEPNAALGPSSATGSPKLEPRVRFVDAQNVSTSRQGSGFFVNTAGLDTNFSLQSMSPTSPLNTGTLPGDASDAQSQKSNLSSALTMESMLTIISTPSMIQGPSSSLPTPVVPVTAPTLPTQPTPPADSQPTDLESSLFVTDTSVEHRPSQGSIGAVRPITGILINRNAGSPAVGSATSQKPSYRRETVLSSSEEEDEGGNESDGTINDNKVVCEGYLYKQGTKYKQSWKKRWIVLRNGKITCYKNNGEYVVKRMVPLRNVLDVHEVDQQGRHQHCFKVVLSKRALTLSAESAEDLQRWVTVLRAAHKTVMRRIAQEGDNEE